MIHAYWLRKLTALHERLAAQMNKLLTDRTHIKWVTEAQTVLILKDPQKGVIAEYGLATDINYFTITSLRKETP